MNCIGALSFLRLEEEYWFSYGFYDSKRSIGEVLFFNQFYWSEFLSGKWNAWKNLEWFGCWTKVKSGAKREWFFVHTAVFERARNWCVKKFSLSERNFFVHVRLLKAVFCNFSGLWGLIMILYWIWARSERSWRFQVVNWSFMQIWRFLISFADFSTKFNVFWPFVLFYCFKCNLHRSSLLKEYQGYKLITILLV